MKLSVSLADEDVAFIDRYANDANMQSRSAVLRHAIALLRNDRLGDDYEAAWDEWYASGEAALWDSTSGDGIEPFEIGDSADKTDEAADGT